MQANYVNIHMKTMLNNISVEWMKQFPFIQ